MDARIMMMGRSAPAEAQALAARMSTPPTAARKNLISKTIRALKTAGIWDKLDVLYLLAAADSQAALLNWKGATYDATNNGAAFTADRGFTGDGAGDYIDTNYGSLDGQFSATSHTFGRVLRVGSSNAYTDMGAWDGSTSSTFARVHGDVNGLSWNSGLAGGVSGLSIVGHMSISRVGATATAYRNGLLLGSSSNTFTASGHEFFLLALNNGGSASAFTTSQMSAAWLGAALTAGETATLHAILSTYLAAVGA